MEFSFYGRVDGKGDVVITSECLTEPKEFGTIREAREWVSTKASAYGVSNQIIWN